MHYFDFEKVAREAGISSGQLRQLCDAMHREFPTDEMMRELHVLRACMAIKNGLITVEDALRVETVAGRNSGATA
jgi:AraC-like DNA-binding protein